MRLQMNFLKVIVLLLCISVKLNASDTTCDNYVNYVYNIYEQFHNIISTKLEKTEKISSIATLIESNIDIKYLAEFVLRKEWDKASDQQRQEFIDGYKRYTVNNYANLIEKYFGNTEIIGAKSIRRSQCVINAKIMYRESPVHVSYFIIKREDKFYIFDLAIEGIRTAITQRSEFQSVISRTGLNGLINQLKQHN